LLFTDLCWVEIRERSGQMLLSQHFSAGQQTLVEGRPPFEITLGNAAMARLSYDGKTIDLTPHTRQNVARLQLP
jgi:cytoskeleton protein RodZ